jgi:hypothetical protein
MKRKLCRRNIPSQKKKILLLGFKIFTLQNYLICSFLSAFKRVIKFIEQRVRDARFSSEFEFTGYDTVWSGMCILTFWRHTLPLSCTTKVTYEKYVIT